MKESVGLRVGNYFVIDAFQNTCGVESLLFQEGIYNLNKFVIKYDQSGGGGTSVIVIIILAC